MCIEKIMSFFLWFVLHISIIEPHNVVNQKFIKKNIVWHDQLGHLVSIMIQKIFENSCEHPWKSQRILWSNDFSCIMYSQGKLVIRLSPEKIRNEAILILERIQCDICGSIHPPFGSFKYFMMHQLNGLMFIVDNSQPDIWEIVRSINPTKNSYHKQSN